MMPKGWELVIILLVILLLFGGKKIPEIAKGLGKGIRDFKSALGGSEDPENNAAKNQTKPEVKSLPPDSQNPNS